MSNKKVLTRSMNVQTVDMLSYLLRAKRKAKGDQPPGVPATELRSASHDMGYKRSGPAFYTSMTRLIKNRWVLNRIESHSRTYEITVAGEAALDKFFSHVLRLSKELNLGIASRGSKKKNRTKKSPAVSETA